MTDKKALNINESLAGLRPDQLSALIERAAELKLVDKKCSQEELADAIDKAKGKIQSEMLFRLGDKLIDNNDIELSLIILTSSVGGAAGAEHELPLQNSLGLAYYMNGKLKEAIEIFSKLLKSKMDNTLKSSTLHYLGLSYFDAGTYAEAIKKLEAAAKLYESDKNIEAAIPPIEDVARVYQEQNEHEKALKILEKAYDYSKEIMLENYIARISASKGESFIAIGKYRSASEALEFSLQDRTSPFDTLDRMRLLAHSYTLVGSDEKAEVAFEELCKLAEITGEKEEMINSLDLLGRHYNNVEKYAEAKSILRQSYNLRLKYQEESGTEFPGSWEFCQILENVNKMVEFQEAKYTDKLGIKPHPAYDLNEQVKQSMSKLIELLDLGIDEPSAYALKYSGKNLKEATNDFQKEYILQILRLYEWDKAAVAKHLGVSTSNLYHYLYKLGIER